MEMGADIIAGALAAMQTYPHKNLLVVDLGTITTITPLTKNRECLGSTFIPGIGTAMNSFAVKATKLFAVEIITPKKCLGRSTAESMQAGLFFGHLGAIKEIIQRISAEIFPHDQPLVIATGGFAKLFEREKIFNHIEPDLILKGLKIVHKKS